MRILLPILVVLAAGFCIGKPAEAQNGGWCAYLNDADGGQRICGFVKTSPYYQRQSYRRAYPY
jgi:hypothetical protein